MDDLLGPPPDGMEWAPGPLPGAPEWVKQVALPYLTALWAIEDICEVRMEQLRALGQIESAEAQNIEEIWTVLAHVPGLIPRPARGKHD